MRTNAQLFRQPAQVLLALVLSLLVVLGAAAATSAAAQRFRLHDQNGEAWSLSNTSAMMVPSEQAALPAGSAQFSLEALDPAPSESRPLLLRIPLEPGGEAVIISDPALTAALHRAGKRHPAPFR
jgi:hypothetical protein